MNLVELLTLACALYAAVMGHRLQRRFDELAGKVTTLEAGNMRTSTRPGCTTRRLQTADSDHQLHTMGEGVLPPHPAHAVRLRRGHPPRQSPRRSESAPRSTGSSRGGH